MMSRLKAIVIGHGSIGRRHERNLQALGVDVRAVDIDEANKLNQILSDGSFDMSVVCTPTHLHVDHCLMSLEHVKNLFCEKPLFHDPADKKIDDLIDMSLCATTMVGCNLRFHETIWSVPRDVIDKTMKVSAIFGHDLRKWHPDSNHRASYSANKSMGGGILLDAIHEPDYISWWFGEIERVTTFTERVSNVTVDSDDRAIIDMTFKNGVVANVELDYISQEYKRSFTLSLADSSEYHRDINPSDRQYLDEMKHFIECVEHGQKPMNSVVEATYLLDEIFGWHPPSSSLKPDRIMTKV